MFTLTICTVHPARKLAQTGKKLHGPQFCIYTFRNVADSNHFYKLTERTFSANLVSCESNT